VIAHAKNVVTIDGVPCTLAYAIADAIELKHIIVILYDPGAYSKKSGQFRNVVGVDRSGKQMWIADLPTTTSGDRYYSIRQDHGLRASSIYSYECELDSLTGHIIGQIFVK